MFLLEKTMGPEGSGRKNFKIWTQSEVAPKGLYAGISSLKRFKLICAWSAIELLQLPGCPSIARMKKSIMNSYDERIEAGT